MASSRHLLVVDQIVRGIEDGHRNRPIIFVRLRNRGRSRSLGRVHADPEGRRDSASGATADQQQKRKANKIRCAKRAMGFSP
jgi:hypothetical protein